MYENDFFLTWEKTDEELEAVWTVAGALRFMRENNISTKKYLRAASASPYSGDNFHPYTFLLCFCTATCWVWKFRIWTKARARLLNGGDSS